jgi:hypothetical protein
LKNRNIAIRKGKTVQTIMKTTDKLKLMMQLSVLNEIYIFKKRKSTYNR